jgi:8-oxo-dGTP pyrophosphatase MutT (NUDIX family)
MSEKAGEWMVDQHALEWVRLGGSLVYDGFVKVRQDRFRLPHVEETDWDLLLEGESVAIIAVTADLARVVMFEQYRPGPGRVLLEIPGGAVDPGEEVIAAALRELREETGYEAGAVFQAPPEWASSNSERRRHLVIAGGCHGAGEPEWDAHELGAVREMPLAAFIDHVINGELTDAGLAVRGLVAFSRAAAVDPALVPLRDAIRQSLVAP